MYKRQLYREEDVYKMLEPVSESGNTPTTANGDAEKGPGGIGSATIKVPSPQEVDLAFSPTYLGLMIFVATIEWILRKRWRLK